MPQRRELETPGAFNARRLVSEIVSCDREFAYAQRHKDLAMMARWWAYQQRLLDWRYMVIRGLEVKGLCPCPECERILQCVFNQYTECFNCRRRVYFHE